MNTIRTFAATAGAMLLLYAGTTLAQGIKMPAPSPTQTIKQDFALSNIELSYSRPLKNGRVIMGDLVPYGKVWRTGANSATTITKQSCKVVRTRITVLNTLFLNSHVSSN